jgi:hypothetical protein
MFALVHEVRDDEFVCRLDSAYIVEKATIIPREVAALVEFRARELKRDFQSPRAVRAVGAGEITERAAAASNPTRLRPAKPGRTNAPVET